MSYHYMEAIYSKQSKPEKEEKKQTFEEFIIGSTYQPPDHPEKIEKGKGKKFTVPEMFSSSSLPPISKKQKDMIKKNLS